jgi:hypothetical protein
VYLLAFAAVDLADDASLAHAEREARDGAV